MGKISLTSPIAINVPTRTSLVVETKGLLFLRLGHVNNKSNVCKQNFPIPSFHLCRSALITARSALYGMNSAENTFSWPTSSCSSFFERCFWE